MTNHSEAAGPLEPNEFVRPDAPVQPPGGPMPRPAGPVPHPGEQAPRSGDSLDEPVVTLRTPAELADALPYLLGFTPEESIVLIALHGERGRFGGRVRLGVPERAEDWPCVAEQLAQCLVGGCERRGARPEGVVAFLCQEPVGAETGQQVVERLRPLAQVLRTACGRLDVPVFEVVCISQGRFWTYCCPDTRCCPPEGIPLLRPGTSVLAAAATYMGVQPGATQGEMRGRLTPWETAAATDQERALDAASLELLPRMLREAAQLAAQEAAEEAAQDGDQGAGQYADQYADQCGDPGEICEEGESVAAETLDLARRIMARLDAAPPASGPLEADNRDDELIAHDEAAALIFGLQVPTTRDRAAEWMEGAEGPPALRLWRALSRRCVGAYAEYAAAPLALAGWVAWSLGDLAEGQEALAMALGADSRYAFALLLNRACNDDMDPEAIRRCLRRKREAHDGASPRPGRRRRSRPAPGVPQASGGPGRGPQSRRRLARRIARRSR
ncbi:DUF4192 domain-containing protein [Streptomyces atriruber]|uniref:DUF4192 domain-containing protein n=1 Tax=Streptomyces atriruber TaxID=545121 RepID=A0ABV3C186_9ACTN